MMELLAFQNDHLKKHPVHELCTILVCVFKIYLLSKSLIEIKMMLHNFVYTFEIPWIKILNPGVQTRLVSCQNPAQDVHLNIQNINHV